MSEAPPDVMLDDCLAGGGELGARMRAIDWSRTPLGPVASWPQSLKTCVRIVLTSRQAMFVWWGDELINLYNDAYRAIVGGKHPAALGQPAAVVWREIWDQVGPRAASAMRTNEGTYDEALLLIMERYGYPEETYYTFSYSPVPNDQGGTGGILCANTDDTQRIIGERQLALLRELAACTAEVRTVAEVCAQSSVALASNPRDLPFALIYLADPARPELVTLAGATGIARGHGAAPAEIALDAPGAVWPLAATLGAHELRVLEGAEAVPCALPSGAWDRASTRVALVPIASTGQTGRAGVLVVGLNPFRLADEGYRGFLGLVAGQIAASLGNAQAYEEEKKRAEALAEIDRAKTAFFSNVSHEFRTPLTLLLGPTEDALASPERVLTGEGLATVHRNALRLLRLVNSLLDFSRIEAGRVQAVYVPTDLAVLTADLASAFRAAIERAGLTLRVECPPLPQPVYVDPRMWEKVVLNLISNAFKFTFEGEIAVALRAVAGGIELTVSDTGTGIPAAELPHLFERFHRVEGARSRSFEGSGIGLALVHDLVQLHGGTIGVESTVDRGTCFTVAVPFGTAHLPAERVAATNSEATMASGALPFVEEALRWLPEAQRSSSPEIVVAPEGTGGRVATDDAALPRARVLLADDNADMRDYVRRLLAPRVDVDAVTDGQAALESARRRVPDLVLTDVMMPRLDGFGLLRALRAEPATRAVPVVMLSARAGDEARVEGIEAGADDYLTKPFSARELLARVALHLELARARRAVDAERRRLYELFMRAPAAICALRGPEHVFEFANSRFDEIVGRRASLGRPLREALPEAVERGLLEVLDRVYAHDEPLSGREERRMVRTAQDAAPRERFFNFVYQPSHDAAGRVDGVLTFAFEVTDQVRARREAEALSGQRAELLAREQQTRAEAERANRLKDEFLATMSHELRTPLTAMLGWARMLRTGMVPAEKQARAIEAIERNARTQAALIEDVLDVARIVSGKLRLAVGPVETAAVVDAAVDTVRPAAEAKGVRLQVLLDPDAGMTMGDPDRLQQVVWNLLSNAVKFTPRGGRVHVVLQREASCVEIVVADTGQGIAPEFLPHVFERFRQADATITRTHSGLGLGLSIVKHLVELHGGTIEAASAGVGQGATFTVRIPVAPVRASAAPEVVQPAAKLERSSPRLECPAGLAGLRVLVVDDEPDARELIASILEQCQIEVATAGSAAEAFACFERQRPDLVLSDIGMPGEDGYALVRRLRALPSAAGGRTPAVALTAYARSEDRTRALVEGFTNHVSKPVDPQELLAVVASASGRSTRVG